MMSFIERVKLIEYLKEHWIILEHLQFDDYEVVREYNDQIFHCYKEGEFFYVEIDGEKMHINGWDIYEVVDVNPYIMKLDNGDVMCSNQYIELCDSLGLDIDQDEWSLEDHMLFKMSAD